MYLRALFTLTVVALFSGLATAADLAPPPEAMIFPFAPSPNGSYDTGIAITQPLSCAATPTITTGQLIEMRIDCTGGNFLAVYPVLIELYWSEGVSGPLKFQFQLDPPPAARNGEQHLNRERP